MHWQAENFDKSTLKNHEDMLILKGEEEAGLWTVLAFNKEDGFTGATFLAPDGMTAERIAEGMDSSDEEFYAELNFTYNVPIADWISLTSSRTEFGVPPEYMEFVRDNIQPRVLDLINLRGIVAQVSQQASRDKVSVINYFVAGDTEARYQAALALPLTTAKLIASPTLRAVVDARQPLTPVLMEELKLDKRKMKSLLVAEKILCEPATKEMEKDVAKFLQLRSACDVGTNIAMLSNTQLPQNFAQLNGFTKFISEMESTTRAAGLSQKPYLRILKSFKSEDLADAMSHLKFQVQVADRDNPEAPPKQVLRGYFDQQQRDYIKRICRVITAAEMASQLRDMSPELMAKARDAAHKAWNDEVLATEEAELLKAFSQTIQGISNGTDDRLLKQFLTDQLSFKDLRALEERWHHVQATLDDKSLNIEAEIDWKTMLGQVNMPEGVVAREISSSKWLTEQGRDENHCVGGYTGTVLNARDEQADMIWSIEQNGRILSTVHIQMTIERDWRGKVHDAKMRTIQHQAKGNTRPSDLAMKAVGFLTRKLDALPIEQKLSYIKSIRTNSKQVTLDLNRAILSIQANVLNDDLPETILAVHDRVLPAGLRKCNIDEIKAKLNEYIVRERPSYGSNFMNIEKSCKELVSSLIKEPKAEATPELAI